MPRAEAGPARASLRAAVPGDATTIAALAVQVFLDTYASDGVRPDLAREAFHEYSTDRFAARLAEPGRRFVLAEVDDGLLGFAEIAASRLDVPAGGLCGAELVRLYVQPAAQRRGIGRALLADAERVAAAASLPALWLTAWDGNLRARSFYARHGYADVGATTYTFQGRTYANRVLAKVLPGDEGADRDAVEPAAAAMPDAEFFRALERRRTQALVQRDLATLEALHAPDYQLLTPAGKAHTRESYLGLVRAEPFYAAWDVVGEMSVRVSADMAAIRYQARLAFPSGRVVLCWHTDLYERRPAGWQAVWSQATELAR